jgi:hypothetical protein
MLLLACLASRARAEPCPFGVTPGTTERLFERVKNLSVGEGYHFEGVSANPTELSMRWSRDGVACPPIQVGVDNCWSPLGLPTLQLRVPPAVSVRCPQLQAVMGNLAKAVSADQTVGWLLSVGIVLVAACLIRRLRAPAGGPRRGWRIFEWLLFAVAAAIPFYFNASLAVTMELGAAWLVFAVLLFDSESLSVGSGAPRRALLALCCFSLLLDWWLSSGGPGDLRLNLVAIWSPDVELRWGPAPIAFFRLLGLFSGSIQDTHIIWSSLILSSLLPILLYGILVELGVGQVAAVVSAFVVAAHPLLIVFSGVLNRQAIYLFAAFGSVLALLGFLRHGKSARFVAFVLGAVLATTSRPEGGQVLILYLVVLLLVPASWRVRVSVGTALAVLIPGTFLYLRYAVESKPPVVTALASQVPLLWTVLFSRDFTPVAWIVAWAVGVVVGVRRRAAWVAVFVLLGLDIAWRRTGLYQMFVGHERQIASARYESVLLVPFAIGIALLIHAILDMNTWLKASVLAAFAVCTVLTYRRPYETLLQPFTIDHEYRFLKKYAATLPPYARLYILDAPMDDIGLLDAHQVGYFVRSAVTFKPWSERDCDELRRDPSPAYLYIGSSCAELVDDALDRPLWNTRDYPGWMRDCAAIRERVAADPVELIDVPARKMSWHDFKERTVRLALYRLNDPSLCALGPHSQWTHRAPADAHP